MNQFENKLILKEEAYENSFFPRIPKTGKRGSAYILTGGYEDDIIVDEHTTAKRIRHGKYTQLVEISTLPYIKEIRIHATSKESYYYFDVYVKAVIQVQDPLAFYGNRNIDVDAYFENMFLLDVEKITKRYSILNYDGMDEQLTEALSSYSTIDEMLGFSYQISAVSAKPGENGEEYIRQYGKQHLEAQLNLDARTLAEEAYSIDYKMAIKKEMAMGKLTEAEGIQQIDKYQQNQIKKLEELKEVGVLTETDLKLHAKEILLGTATTQLIEQYEYDSDEKEKLIDKMSEFYAEDMES